MNVDEIRRDTIVGIIEDELTARMSMGTSGRWILDYGLDPEDLAHLLANRVAPGADQ